MLNQDLYDHLELGLHIPAELNHTQVRNDLVNFMNTHAVDEFYPNRVSIAPAGTVLDRLMFVEQGFVRGHVFNQKKLKESSVYLWNAHSFVLINHFLNKQPLNVSLQIMPGARLFSVSREDVMDLYLKYPFLKVALIALALKDYRYSSKNFQDPDLSSWEVLEQVRIAYPKIELYVPKEVIASFIGISPQHLSKIIKENG